MAMRALPELADLAMTIKPEQLAQMEKKFNKNNETYRKKFLTGSVEDRQCSASAAACGTVAVSTGSTNISVSQNACPP